MLALAIARLTVQELLRRRLFLVLIGLTVLVIAFTSWGFGQITTAGGRPLARVEQVAVVSQLLILVAFMFSFTLSFAAVFAGAPSLSGDVESGTALAILARPISRAEFVIGKWLGVVLTIVIYAVPTTAVQLFMVDRIVQYVPPHPLQFVAFMVLEGMVILTLALALSTRFAGMVGGVVALIFWGVGWIGGIVGGIGLALGNETATHVGTATRLLLPTDGMWRGAVWSLEPATIIAGIRAAGSAAAGNPFFAAEPPEPLYLAWTLAWIALGLAVAVWSFSRREV
ncbi:MAG TPA: ABC transporter permease subunit [Candidatus Limnocylindria bacterium]|nr:ABC transporter permease subunit [Candidatus Limnocylindria bacterium]